MTSIRLASSAASTAFVTCPELRGRGVSLGLAAWYALESHGALLGLAERCRGHGAPLWLFAVAVHARRSRRRYSYLFVESPKSPIAG